jgi:hypothetical protein
MDRGRHGLRIYKIDPQQTKKYVDLKHNETYTDFKKNIKAGSLIQSSDRR